MFPDTPSPHPSHYTDDPTLPWLRRKNKRIRKWVLRIESTPVEGKKQRIRKAKEINARKLRKLLFSYYALLTSYLRNFMQAPNKVRKEYS